MTSKRLLEHFDRIAEAPDAVPRLRRFILDLAVRGKLVEQNPKDEPASNGADLSNSPRVPAPNLLIFGRVSALLRRMAVFADARLGGRAPLGAWLKKRSARSTSPCRLLTRSKNR